MFSGHSSYLLTILVFAGAAVLIEWLMGRDKLKKYWKLTGIVVGLGLLFTVTEALALWLKAWQYNPGHVLHFRVFGAQIETYIFTLLTAVAVIWATLIFAQYEDEGKPLIKTAFRIKSKKPRKN